MLLLQIALNTGLFPNDVTYFSTSAPLQLLVLRITCITETGIPGFWPED